MSPTINIIGNIFYEEHSCPTNWLDNCAAVIENGDDDPHGFLRHSPGSVRCRQTLDEDEAEWHLRSPRRSRNKWHMNRRIWYFVPLVPALFGGASRDQFPCLSVEGVPRFRGVFYPALRFRRTAPIQHLVVLGWQGSGQVPQQQPGERRARNVQLAWRCSNPAGLNLT